MRVAQRLVWFIILLLLLSGCTAQAAAEPATIKVVMGDHNFRPAQIRVKAGQPVRIELVNGGQVPHDFMVGLELQRLTWGAKRLEQDFFQGLQVVHSERNGTFGADPQRGTELVLYPGGSGTLVFTVPAEKKGEWEIGCLLPGHYEAGMRATLIVE